MIEKRKNTRGVSLMETVIYVSLVALLSVMVVEALLSLGKVFKYVRATRDIENSALVALDRIAKEIRRADAVLPGGVFGTTTPTGKLILSYSAGTPATREFSVDGSGVLRIIEDGVDGGSLTSRNILVKTFWLEEATTSERVAIRVTLTLEDKIEKTNPREATFYTAAAMRGLY